MQEGSKDDFGKIILGDPNVKLIDLPPAGSILVYDCRIQSTPPSKKQLRLSLRKVIPKNLLLESSDQMTTLKCVQWNIERGYKLDAVIQTLKNQYADIICLQELDIGCRRSNDRNCALEIAMALGMKCAFFTEFEEIYSLKRATTTQGGGAHGNAILSRYDFTPRLVRHTFQPFDWPKKGSSIGEPRRGERAILVAEISIPNVPSPVVVYSLHLEVFCGIFGRLAQFSDVLDDSRRMIKEGKPYQLIFGDLNTMAHGLARFSPRFCTDHLRLRSIGYSEAAWWHHHLFEVLQSSNPEEINQRLALHQRRLGPSDNLKRLINPHFFDPFSIFKDTTLQGYHGIYQGKLDWTLLRGWRVLGKGMDNHFYRDSDHKLLYVIIRPCLINNNIDFDGKYGNDDDPGILAYKEMQLPFDKRKEQMYEFFYSAIRLILFMICIYFISRYFLCCDN